MSGDEDRYGADAMSARALFFFYFFPLPRSFLFVFADYREVWPPYLFIIFDRRGLEAVWGVEIGDLCCDVQMADAFRKAALCCDFSPPLGPASRFFNKCDMPLGRKHTSLSPLPRISAWK